MKTEKIFKTVSVLSSTGIILAIYLLFNFISTSPFDVCSINATINCDAVTKGSLATIFGIPVSLIGLIGYILILYSSIKKHHRLMLFMTAFGMVFCLRLTILEIFVEKVFCPVCALCQIIMAIVFILSLVLFRKKNKK